VLVSQLFEQLAVHTLDAERPIAVAVLLTNIRNVNVADPYLFEIPRFGHASTILGCMTTEREPRTRMTQERWQAITNWPLNIAAIAFLVAYSAKVIGNDHEGTGLVLLAVMIAVWAVFLINYLIMLALARNARWKWVRSNWWQIPITALPALEPLRLLRLVELTNLLPSKTAGNRLRGRVGLYVVSTLILAIYVGALGVLDAEQNAPGANILTLGDALWWAIVTVTTVGYGDFVPITTQGRLVAAALMLSGVALIGTITGTLASFLGERTRAHDSTRVAASSKQVDDLAAQIAALESQLQTRSAGEPEATGRGEPAGREPAGGEPAGGAASEGTAGANG
jgi:voltage-gated potassium channel